MGYGCWRVRISITVAGISALIISFFFGYINFSYQSLVNNTYSKAPLNIKSSLGNPNTNASLNKCGVILFYHIPKTGGGSVKEWLSEHTTVLDTYQIIRKDKNYNENKKKYETLWKKVLPIANQFVSTISPKHGWKSIHLHHLFPGMYYNQDIVRNWKMIVEGKCLKKLLE